MCDRSEAEAYIEKASKLFKANPKAFAHFSLKKNLKREYKGLKENVEAMLKTVATPKNVFQYSRHVYVEFENPEALENVFDLYVKQKTLKYAQRFENPRMEKVDPVLAALILQYVHVFGHPVPPAQKRKNDESPAKESPKKKVKADEEDDE